MFWKLLDKLIGLDRGAPWGELTKPAPEHVCLFGGVRIEGGTIHRHCRECGWVDTGEVAS